jgi:hypothetical protein
MAIGITSGTIAWPLGGLTIAWDVFANNGDLSVVREHWNSLKMFVQQYINAGRKDKKFKYLFLGGGLSNHLDLSRSSNSGYDQNVILGRTLSHVKGTYKSVYGTIESSWRANPSVVNEKSGISDMTAYSAVVPANTAAVLYLPLGKTISKESLKGFKNIPGVTFVGTGTNDSLEVGEFKLKAGGYDLKVVDGTLIVTLQKGYVVPGIR